MFNMPSLKLGSILGIPIEVNASWLIVFALLVFGLSTSVFPQVNAAAAAPVWIRLVAAAVCALLFFMSILAHEMSHSLVVRAQGGRVDGITLFIFGGVSRMEDEPGSPGREFLMAVAGPAMSVVLAILLAVAFSISKSLSAPWWVWVPLQYLAGVNFFVAIFNLLPGFPLDGGRVLRSVLWKMTHDMLKATRWAAWSGQVIGSLMMGAAVVGVLRGLTDFIWIGLVGWFLTSLAGASYQQQLARSRMAGMTVGNVMTSNPVTVPGEITLDRLVHDFLLGEPHTRYPVLHQGEVIGLVTLDDVKGVDRSDWPRVTTADVTNRDLRHIVIDASAPVTELAARLSSGSPALIVAEEGRLAGIATRADLVSLMKGSEG